MPTAETILANARDAAAAYHEYDQARTDRIVHAVYRAGFDARVKLARMAREETNLGVWQHKVLKNVIATQLVYEDIRHERTVGVICEDRYRGITEVAHPVGPILAMIPVTNPTATTLFKILIALKTRNPVIISPHGAAKRCTVEAASICYQAALDAGAPAHCLQWIPKASPQKLHDIMTHRDLALILATGASSLVRSAYKSGKPTIGVGAGNVPVYIGETADVPFAVQHIMESKLLDNGSICASEQAVVVKTVNAEQVIDEFKKHKAYFLSPDEIQRVGEIAYEPVRGTMTASVVGQPASVIAEKAGFAVPPDTSVLIARLDGVGPDYPLSAEILAPILAFYVEQDFEDAIRRCSEVTNFGGRGHTASIFSNSTERIRYFCEKVAAARLLVNMPSTQGALGGTYNSLHPSYTLGCGAAANNTTTDNITVRHLLTIHRISRRRLNERWMNFNHEKYLDESVSAADLEAEFNRNY
jgi:acetaldehyde dehydrogenase/alcohol dehydrogenase